MRARLEAACSIYLFWVMAFLIARLFFLAYHHSEAIALGWGDIWGAFAAGARLDLSAAAYLTTPVIIFLAIGVSPRLLSLSRTLIRAWIGLAIVVMVGLIVADLEIARAWNSRIDAAILPYLTTPREAWASAGESPRWLLLVLALAVTGAAVWAARMTVLVGLDRLAPDHGVVALATLGCLGPLWLAGRGGLQTWPLTVSSAFHSANSFVNLAAQNAAWGFFDSAARRVYDRSNPYRVMPDSAAASTIDSTRRPIGPRHPAPLRLPRPNIVLILWESASARAFGSLGGAPGVTPGFDSLARTGILFRRFYSAADRTEKGVAAVLSATPATPRGAIVTVPRKAATLPSLGEDLEPLGYRTAFYYGGELEFASLQAYLVNKSVDRIVGDRDFPRATRTSKWGAHDGVVAARLLADLGTLPEPFFAVWLTLSSHEPFETPDADEGKPSDWQGRFFGSLRYTDRVIREWVQSAATSPWWSRTLVVIVADHGRRIRPLDAGAPPRDPEADYRIPMLWLGGALSVRDSVVDEPASQLDLAPTLRDMLGLEPSQRYRFGRSLLRPVELPFAYYGFDEGFAIVTGDGHLVYDQRAGRVTSRKGPVGERERLLGAALLQTTYQDYLDR
jgi:hypothetical protein